MADQNIQCGVNSCRYNRKGIECSLDAIMVGSDDGSGNAQSKKETKCDSFEEEN